MRALGIILAFAAALWSGRLQAQHYIGVRGGWGGGSVRFQPVRETGIHWGLYSGGLSYKFYTEQKYVGAIQVDLEYMQRGFMYDEVRGGDTSTIGRSTRSSCRSCGSRTSTSFSATRGCI